MFRRVRVILGRIKWRQVAQAMADGAGNTVGTVLIYAIIVLLIFVWYHKKQKQHQSGWGGDEPVLLSALSFSKPAAAMRHISGATPGSQQPSEWA